MNVFSNMPWPPFTVPCRFNTIYTEKMGWEILMLTLLVGSVQWQMARQRKQKPFSLPIGLGREKLDLFSVQYVWREAMIMMSNDSLLQCLIDADSHVLNVWKKSYLGTVSRYSEHLALNLNGRFGSTPLMLWRGSGAFNVVGFGCT